MDTQELYNFRLVCVVILGLEIVLGTMGNAVSLIVWQTGKKCSKAACATYFKILAITDIFVLIVPALKFLLDLSEVSLSHLHSILCKIYGFSELFGLQVSAWLVVCLSVERVLSLCFPFKFHTKGARKRAYISTIVIVIIATGLNSFEVANRTMFQLNQTFENGVIVNKTEEFCVTILSEEYEVIRTVSFIWFLGILPFSFVIACNIIIVLKIFLTRKIRRFTVQHHHKRAASFTKICIGIGTIYCVSTLPLAVHSLNLFRDIKIIEINTNVYIAFRMFAYTCLYFNNSFNFLLYCFTGAEFRNDLKQILPCLKYRTIQSRSITGSSIQQGTSFRSLSSINVGNQINNEASAVSLRSYSSSYIRSIDY